jgi:hypothetical protein
MGERHGKTNSKIYRCWVHMRERCLDKRDRRYSSYGGRGITICERWLKFSNFYEDMGDPPEGMSLDRIDNDGPYSPENCKWSTRHEQQRNRRVNRLVTFNGETKCVREWLGSDRALNARFERGWTMEEIFSIPVDRRK